MEKLICLECGRTFENPKHYTEKHGFDIGPYEEWDGCPYCSGSYADAYKCDECGHWITGEYIKTISGERICENCYTTYELGEE